MTLNQSVINNQQPNTTLSGQKKSGSFELIFKNLQATLGTRFCCINFQDLLNDFNSQTLVGYFLKILSVCISSYITKKFYFTFKRQFWCTLSVRWCTFGIFRPVLQQCKPFLKTWINETYMSSNSTFIREKRKEKSEKRIHSPIAH